MAVTTPSYMYAVQCAAPHGGPINQRKAPRCVAWRGRTEAGPPPTQSQNAASDFSDTKHRPTLTTYRPQRAILEFRSMSGVEEVLPKGANSGGERRRRRIWAKLAKEGGSSLLSAQNSAVRVTGSNLRTPKPCGRRIRYSFGRSRAASRRCPSFQS